MLVSCSRPDRARTNGRQAGSKSSDARIAVSGGCVTKLQRWGPRRHTRPVRSIKKYLFHPGISIWQNPDYSAEPKLSKFDEIAETALVEESAISSKFDRYRPEGVPAQRCSNCGKLGHPSNKCYLRGKGEARVNPVVASGARTLSHLTCFWCGEKGHLARNCKKPLRRWETSNNRKTLGNELRRTENSRPTVASVGCLNREQCDYTILELDVSKGDKVYFLADSGGRH